MHRDDADQTGFDEAAGTFEGRPFPSEAEWLDLPAPPITDDFAARTILALRAAGNEAGDDPLTPELLAAFAAPEPSRGFAATTLRAVQDDRLARWRELLARYVAPDPSPDFVARTLRALARTGADEPHPAPRTGARAWTWPLLAIAAAAALFVLLQRPGQPPVELRIAQQVRPAYAYAYASSPLPAVLAVLARQADPSALPNGGADGLWLLQRRDR